MDEASPSRLLHAVGVQQSGHLLIRTPETGPSTKLLEHSSNSSSSLRHDCRAHPSVGFPCQSERCVSPSAPLGPRKINITTSLSPLRENDVCLNHSRLLPETPVIFTLRARSRLAEALEGRGRARWPSTECTNSKPESTGSNLMTIFF